jgi:hypothetical protein
MFRSRSDNSQSHDTRHSDRRAAEQKAIDALAEWLHNRDHAYDAKHALQFMDTAP